MWVVIFEAVFGCHGILILDKHGGNVPYMTIAVDWVIKHQFKQTNSLRRITNL